MPNLFISHADAVWVKVRTIEFDDADVAIANTTATLTCDPIQCGAAALMQTEVLVVERIQFAGNAGTLVLDVGKSGATEKYAKDVSLKATSGTRTLGSGTTSVKPANAESNGLPVVLTLTSGSGDLDTLTAGAADIYVRYEPLPA